MKGYFRDWSEVKMLNSAVAPYSEQHIGVTAIVPASYLHETLYSEEEVKFREDAFKAHCPNSY